MNLGRKFFCVTLSWSTEGTPHRWLAEMGRLPVEESYGKSKRKGVDIVHTLAIGLGRNGAELARIPRVFASFQCLQGLEASSSPTSGTAYPLVRGVFALC